MRMAMIAITTSSSISVNARRRAEERECDKAASPEEKGCDPCLQRGREPHQEGVQAVVGSRPMGQRAALAGEENESSNFRTRLHPPSHCPGRADTASRNTASILP